MSIPVVERGDLHVEVLIWVEARNKVTRAAEPIGFWTGSDHQILEVAGQSRTYYGGGQTLSVDDIKSRAGVVVQSQKVVLSAVSDQVRLMLDGRDIRQAGVEIHLARYHPAKGVPLGVDRIFKGLVDVAPETLGDSGQVELSLVSAARNLTRKVPLYKSDASQRRRDGDRFFRWADVTGKVPVYWDRKRQD